MLSTVSTNQRAFEHFDRAVERFSPQAFDHPFPAVSSETAPQVWGDHYADAPPRGACLLYETARKGHYRITPAFFEGLPVTFAGRPLWEMEPQPWVPGTRLFCVCSLHWKTGTVTLEPPAGDVTLYYKTGLALPDGASIVVIPPGAPEPVLERWSVVNVTDTLEDISMQHLKPFFIGRVGGDPGNESAGPPGNYFVSGYEVFSMQPYTSF